MFSPYLSVNNGREDGRLPGPQPLSLREVIPGSDLEREGMRRPTSAGGRVWDASEPGRSATLVAHLAGAAEGGCGPLCGHGCTCLPLRPLRLSRWLSKRPDIGHFVVRSSLLTADTISATPCDFDEPLDLLTVVDG